MKRKDLKVVLRLCAARLAAAIFSSDVANLAAIGARLATSDEKIAAARRAALAAGAIDAPQAAERYYRAGLNRLRDAQGERESIRAGRPAQIDRVKTELKRKLAVEAALNRQKT
ncbi:MAG: hypothetical protein ABL957_08845 [Parvularculaceae bacterium]